MEIAVEAKETPFQSLSAAVRSTDWLTPTFYLLALADLATTLHAMVDHGFREMNLGASVVLNNYGIQGLMVYKLLLIFFFLSMVMLIERRNPPLSRGILWAGCGIVGLLAVTQLAFIIGFSL
ncbi:MAG: DUF5658 family protein [Armatimonadota bacterium]